MDKQYKKPQLKDYRMPIYFFVNCNEKNKPICELGFDSVMFLFFNGIYKHEYEIVKAILYPYFKKGTLHMSNRDKNNNIVVHKKDNGKRDVRIIYDNGSCAHISSDEYKPNYKKNK